MAELYSNENFPQPIVDELRRLGHDVRTSHEVGNAGLGIPDDDVLSYATEHDHAVITHNRRDFIQLHRRSPDHAGIIVCTTDLNYLALAGRVDRAIRAHGPSFKGR